MEDQKAGKKANLIRHELKKLIQVFQKDLDDSEIQLVVFPKAYLSVKWVVS